MIFGYTWLMESNLVSGVLLSSEIRLNRAADAWLESNDNFSPEKNSPRKAHILEVTSPPNDGTPIIYSRREQLPITISAELPVELFDGQFTIIKIDEVGLLNVGYLFHLYRNLANGEGIHVVQKLILAEHENERVQDFDDLMYKRAMLPAAFFILSCILIVFIFGRLVTNATTKLLHWFENISIDSLPEAPPKLPFSEMQRIAAGTLATVRREHDAIEHRHQFLRFASHELRTPLAIALANTELLARHGVDVSGMNALARLEESIFNMRSLTDALLWLGRGEAPLPEPEPIDFFSLVDTIVEENSLLAKNNNVTVDIINTQNKPLVQPRVLLMIMCSNLISNAIRYTRDGRIEIRLSNESIEIENRGNQIGNEAADSGHGLGLQLVAWVIERTGWHWDEVEDSFFCRHRIDLKSKDD